MPRFHHPTQGVKMMSTTAIALFGTRVSPRFDCAHDFMLITTSKTDVTEQHTEIIKDSMAILKVRRLAELKINTLICGGIDESSREHLQAHGITVLSNMKGLATDAITSCITSPDLVAPA